MLISTGHGQAVWDYGYSFFKLCLKGLEKLFKLQAQAIAFGIAACLDKKVSAELNS